MSGARREEERADNTAKKQSDLIGLMQREQHNEQQKLLAEQRNVLAEQRNVLAEQRNVLAEQRKVEDQQLKITGQQNSSSADSAMQQSSNEDPWKIKIVLEEFDLTLRLLIPPLMARNFMLPMLNATDYEIQRGFDVEIWDLDTQTSHYLFFIKKSHAYMFMDNWMNDFVFRRGLCLHKVDNWINDFVLRRRLHKGMRLVFIGIHQEKVEEDKPYVKASCLLFYPTSYMPDLNACLESANPSSKPIAAERSTTPAFSSCLCYLRECLGPRPKAALPSSH
ncbi:hypothetical protein VNO80_14504 [Phaseolus coccineus]|uniref:B3 domain-containing protein n=1 Tax=Phaseolus coccineus TaxID=3886 RepID=A0AAN9MPL8_PHACN